MAKSSKKTNKPVDNRSIVRALKILETLGDSRIGLSVAEIARRTGLHRATAHRLIVVLHSLGYVYRSPESLTYTTGFYLHTLGRQRHVLDTIIQFSRPFLQRLSDRLKLTVYLGALTGVQSFICDKVCVPQDHTPVHIGTRLDAHASAIGLALLAYQPQDEVILCYENHQMRAHTRSTVTDLQSLLRQLLEIRRAGFALEDEGLYLGQRSVAAAILNPYGRATCAIAVRGPVARLDDRALPGIVSEVVRSAQDIGAYILKS